MNAAMQTSGNYGQLSGAVAPMNEIPAQLGLLSGNISEAEELIQQLGGRLSSVLPQGPSTASATESPPLATKMGAEIYSFNCRLRQINEALRFVANSAQV
jgi:hypothetical protein